MKKLKPSCWGMCILSHVWLFVTPWTVACQAPLSMEILQARILVLVAISFSRGSSPPRDWTYISCIGRQTLYHWATCIQFSSVARSCLTLCDPVNCSTPGLPVHQQLPEFTQTHVHWVGDAIQPSHPLSSVPFSFLQSFPASMSFPMSQLFASGGQSIGASASVLLMNIQDWFPLGLTGWISLQSKGLSRVFSNTTVQKHQFFGAQLSLLITWVIALSNSVKLWSMPCRTTQDGRVMAESSDKTWSTGEGNSKSLQYSCIEIPNNSMKRQKDRTLKDELPRSVGAQYATGDQGRNNSRKNEETEPK